MSGDEKDEAGSNPTPGGPRLEETHATPEPYPVSPEDGPDAGAAAERTLRGVDSSTEEATVESLTARLDDVERALEEERSRSRDLADRLQRTLADFDNFRKRSRREMDDVKRFAKEDLLSRLLDVVANFERAIRAAPDAEDAFAQGVRMIHRQLVGLLEKEGVERVEGEGAAFDPRVHEAIAREESPRVAEGTILEEFEAGWTLHDRVLRPAKVKVAVGGVEGSPPKASGEGVEDDRQDRDQDARGVPATDS